MNRPSLAATVIPSAPPLLDTPRRPLIRSTPRGSLFSRNTIPADPALISRPVGGFLSGLMGLYVFMHVVPWAEIMLMVLGIDLKTTFITGLLTTLGVVLSGFIGRFWSLGASKGWLALWMLYMLASLFGDYPGRSIPFAAEYGLRFHIFPFLICAVAHTGPQVRTLLYWGSAAAFVILALCVVYGGYSDGRFYVPETSFANPNDLGIALLIGLTFVVMLLYAHSNIAKFLGLAAIPMFVYFILQTGSRANFLTIVVLAIVCMFFAPRKIRIGLAAASPVLLVAMVLLVPAATWDRLTMIVRNPQWNQNTATDSQLARQLLQERAIDLTMRRPLTGVGPLMFADAVEEMVRADTGFKSQWQGAHNVYLQIAAENGVIALALYIWLMLWTIRLNFKALRLSISRPDLKPYEGQSWCLLMLTVGFGFGIIFGNYTYDALWAVLVGLTAANHLALTKSAQAPAPAAPATA